MSDLVSVVVLCYGHWDLTDKFIKSFFTWLDYPCELVVLDNGSPDNTWQELQRVSEGWDHLWLEDFQILHVDKNLGVPAGWNYAIKYTRGDYICIANNDMVFQSPFLTPMLATLKLDSKVGCTGWFHMVWSGIPFIEGSCWMLPRSVWNSVGEFDETYSPGTMEDVDWQVRMRKLGWMEKWTPGIKIDHIKHQSRPGVISIGIEKRNKFYFCEKFGFDTTIMEEYR